MWCKFNILWPSALWRMLEAQAVQDAGESSQEFTVGVRRDKACSPFSSPPFPLSKKGGREEPRLAAVAHGELSQFLFLYIKCRSFQVEPFCCVYHMRFGLCSQARWCKLCDFLISRRARFDKFLSFTPTSLHHPPLRLSTAIDWLADIKTPASWQKLHLNPQYFAGVFQAAAVSHINARHAPRQTELNWSALFTLYIDKMSFLFKRRTAIGVVNTLLHHLGKITLKRAWMKMAVLSSHFVLERREEARFF